MEWRFDRKNSIAIPALPHLRILSGLDKDTDPQYGQILVDANGRTLYYFARDTPGAGKSVCTAGCRGAWPPFDAPAVRVSPPLNAATSVRSPVPTGRSRPPGRDGPSIPMRKIQIPGT